MLLRILILLHIAVWGLIGKGLVYLAYGEEGIALRKDLGRSNLPLYGLWGLVFNCWFFVGFGIYILSEAALSRAVGLAVLILVPLLYLVWAISARRSVPKLDEQLQQEYQQRRAEEKRRQEEWEQAEALRLREQAEQARREEARIRLAQSPDSPDSYRDLLREARECQNIRQISALWKSCPKGGMSPELIREVEELLAKKERIEQLYGATDRRTAELLSSLSALSGGRY